MVSEILIWGAAGVCLLALLILSWKLYHIRRAADEIAKGFAERLAEDTNTLIDIGSGDAHMKRLAADINRELRVLRRKRQRFEEGDLEIRDTVTNISHDLRTPLTAIYGYLELLKKENLPEQAQKYLAVIEERTDALKALTEELFCYSLSASAAETAFEPVELNRQLEESFSAYYAALTRCRIEPVIEMPEDPVVRTLNRGALNRIFGNILSNAVKYSDGDLFVSLASDGRITFSNYASRLDEVQAGRLFDRFYTVENARNSTGLGLSIARSLTEQMGGEISVRYADGRLEITVYFPG